MVLNTKKLFPDLSEGKIAAHKYLNLLHLLSEQWGVSYKAKIIIKKGEISIENAKNRGNIGGITKWGGAESKFSPGPT